MRELQIQRQRRIEIRERLEDERYAVVALRGQCAKLRVGDDVPPTLALDAAALPPRRRTSRLGSGPAPLMFPPRLRLTPLRCPRGGAIRGSGAARHRSCSP